MHSAKAQAQGAACAESGADALTGTLGITQGFSLAQACLFRVMREPQQSKAPPLAGGAPPRLHVSPCA